MSDGWSAAYAMVYRQVRRFARAKSRILGTVVNPLVFFLFFGLGMSFSLRGALPFGGDYLAFLSPGIVAMAAFSTSFVGGVTIIFDREFGFMREVLIAPAPRSVVMLGRVIGDSLTSTLQTILIALLVYFMVPSLRLGGLLPVIGVTLLTSLLFNGLGSAMASRMRSPEGFHVVISILMLPVVFLSGAFYPIDALPVFVRPIFLVNPLTYSVDLMRFFMTGSSSFPAWMDLSVLILLGMASIYLSARLFEDSTG